MKEENIVIIGGGLMGSATAWQLAKAGKQVVLLEQQDSIYTNGSSFGEARISRALGPKDDIFAYLQQTSVRQTEELINYLNSTAGQEAHSMDQVYTTSPVTYLYYRSQLSEVNQLLEDQVINHQYAADQAQALQSFGMKVPDSVSVIREFNPYSGTMNPKALIAKLHQAIKSKGGEIRYNEKVVSLKRDGDGFQVITEHTKESYQSTMFADRIVSSAGPYTGELLKDVAPYFNELITPKRLFLAFFKIRNEHYESFDEDQKKRIKDYYPVADLSADIFYSMIEKYDTDMVPILKVGGHYLRSDIDDLDEVWKKQLSEQEVQWAREQTIRYFKMLQLPIKESDLVYHHGYSCVYSLTKSEVPYVTFPMDEDGTAEEDLIVLGGMSGIGAKGALAYGLIAANLLMNVEDTTALYVKTKNALGYDRLDDEVDERWPEKWYETSQ